MAKKKKQKKNTPSKQPVVSRPKEFLDLIAPAAVKFNTDHFILGGTYRSVVALRSYPPTTEELALLRRLGEMAGVTLRLSARRVTTAEEDASAQQPIKSPAVNNHNPAVIAAVTRLLYHMGQIFRDNAMAPTSPLGIRIDSKRRKKLMAKRLALGHKADDHEEQGWQNGPTM